MSADEWSGVPQGSQELVDLGKTALELTRLFKVTPKQARWCVAYVTTARMVASEAAREAGYSDPALNGHRNVHHPECQAALEWLIERNREDYGVLVQRLMDETAAVAFSSITDVLDVVDGELVLKGALSELPRSVRAAIKRIKVRERELPSGRVERTVDVEMHDKLDAQKLLAAMVGARALKHQVAEGDDWSGLAIMPPPGIEADGDA